MLSLRLEDPKEDLDSLPAKPEIRAGVLSLEEALQHRHGGTDLAVMPGLQQQMSKYRWIGK